MNHDIHACAQCGEWIQDDDSFYRVGKSAFHINNAKPDCFSAWMRQLEEQFDDREAA